MYTIYWKPKASKDWMILRTTGRLMLPALMEGYHKAFKQFAFRVIRKEK